MFVKVHCCVGFGDPFLIHMCASLTCSSEVEAEFIAIKKYNLYRVTATRVYGDQVHVSASLFVVVLQMHHLVQPNMLVYACKFSQVKFSGSVAVT